MPRSAPVLNLPQEDRYIQIEEVNKKNELRKKIEEQKARSKAVYIRNIMLVVIIVSAAVVSLLGYVQVTIERDRLYKMQNELKLANEMNRELKLKIDSSIILDEVEKIAKDKLNMTKPLQSQIRYIAIEDTSEDENVLTMNKKVMYNNILVSIINFIKKIF